MKLIRKFKDHYHHSRLAAMWHRWAPSFTLGREFYGATVFMDLRDNIDDLTRSRSELENREECVLASPEAVEGAVWDVGANVGLYSIRAAQLGKPCIAFELSPKSCSLLQKTRDRNGLSFVVVNRAFTAEPIRYNPPISASAENILLPSIDGELESITYLEAAAEFGLPAMIKMDIEGGEEAFFQSPTFRQWIVQNEIAWLVEVHPHRLGYMPEWPDVPHCDLRNNHVLYASRDEQLHLLTSRMQATARSRA